MEFFDTIQLLLGGLLGAAFGWFFKGRGRARIAAMLVDGARTAAAFAKRHGYDTSSYVHVVVREAKEKLAALGITGERADDFLAIARREFLDAMLRASLDELGAAVEKLPAWKKRVDDKIASFPNDVTGKRRPAPPPPKESR